MPPRAQRMPATKGGGAQRTKRFRKARPPGSIAVMQHERPNPDERPNPVAALARRALTLPYTSRAIRSSYVSRRVVTRASPSFTNTTAGRGWPL